MIALASHLADRYQAANGPLGARPVEFRCRTGLRWYCWRDEAEAVVFNPVSGDTHLLNAVDRAALARLEAADSMTVAELSRAVARDMDVEHTPHLAEYIARLLEQFSELGLIESVAA